VTILLTSSDSQARYALDILTVLAAPEGSIVQFRYEKDIVADDLKYLVRSNKAKGQLAVVAFVANPNSIDACVFPVRFVEITKTTDLAEAIVVRFAVKCYVDVSGWGQDKDSIVTAGRAHLQSAYSKSGTYMAAMGKSGDMPLTPSKTTEQEAWYLVAKRLATFDTFSKTFLTYLSLTNEHEDKKAIDGPNGSVVIKYSRSLIVKCWYYRSSDLEIEDRIVRIKADQNILESTSELEQQILSPYDEVEFWLYANQVTQKSRRTVVVELPGALDGTVDSGDLTTRVSIPVTIYRPFMPRIIQWIITAVGAGLVATPGFFDKGDHFQEKLVIGTVGAFLVATASVFSDKFTGARS
jgi:hypothetical protein